MLTHAAALSIYYKVPGFFVTIVSSHFGAMCEPACYIWDKKDANWLNTDMMCDKGWSNKGGGWLVRIYCVYRECEFS